MAEPPRMDALAASPPTAGRLDQISDDVGIQELIDAEFDGQPGLYAEFAALVGPANRARRWGVREDSRLVAHAAWRPLRLVSHERTLEAACIGMVVTAAARRGHGLATALVEACVEHARRDGAELAILFSPPRSLYSAAGFVPAGRERAVRVTPRADESVGRASPDDVEALHALLETQPLRAERSAEEFRALLGIPDTHVWTTRAAGTVTAYAIEGKGRDLQGMIHEWAGSTRDVARIAGHVAAERDEPTFLAGPADLASPIHGMAQIDPLALVKILRPERFGTRDPRRAFGDAHRFAPTPIYVWGLDSA